MNFKKGFTLIELLVVMAIISMLSSIVMAGFKDAKERGRDTGKIRALHEVRSALNLYITDNRFFPDSTTTLVNWGSIKAVRSEIIYKPLNSDGSTCSSACMSYHLGIALERTDNKVLSGDKDVDYGSLYGTSTDCVTSGSTPDKCYDVMP